MIDADFRIKWCPVCDREWIEIVKDTKTNELYCFCAECETQWEEPEAISGKAGKREPRGEITEPTIEEVEALGWHQYLDPSAG